MPIAAVPDYLQKAFKQDFKSATPGLRFGMLFKYWGIDRKTGQILWGGKDQEHKTKKDGRPFVEKIENKRDAIDAACDLAPSGSDRMIAALEARAGAAAARMNANPSSPVLELSGYAVAPFATGLGNEHPLENGFSFLNPYGIPYLPGSGVKGVLRETARQLAAGRFGTTGGWSTARVYPVAFDAGTTMHLSMIDVLFGLESEDHEKEHVRGALSFWDAIPGIEGNRLRVEVMTAHQSHYYQKKETPHESGMPNPIYFLTVPPGSGFTFRVACDLPRVRALAPDLAENHRWKELLAEAFRLAFEWIGFGAKTAVGYGAMSETKPEAGPARVQNAAPGSGCHVPVAPSAPPPGVKKSEEEWKEATLVSNHGQQSVLAKSSGEGKPTADLKGAEAKAFLEALGAERAEKLKKKKTLPGVNVKVRREGNHAILAGIA